MKLTEPLSNNSGIGKNCCCCWIAVMSDSFVTSWTGPPWPLCPWDFPGKNTWVGCHYLLWGIFPTQELNPCLLNLLHWQADALPLCNQGNTFFIVSNNQFDNQLFWHGITVCEFFEYPGTMVYSFHLFFRPNFLKFFFSFTPFFFWVSN